MKKLSFCITCKNRLHQISETLPINLLHNAAAADQVEFVLVDFSSRDGLREWVIENFQEELRTGYLKYFFTESLPGWHEAKAKNTAHYHATGSILVNLDCDNFTGAEGGLFVLQQFEKFGKNLLLHQYGGEMTDGTYGRVSMHRDHFYAVGGYDESFFPVGYHDIDLLQRLTAYGLSCQLVSSPEHSRAIFNTKEEGIRYTNVDMSFWDMNIGNKAISLENLRTNRLMVNGGIMGIRDNIYRYSNQQLIPVQESRVPA